ncbi:polyhydroxyalkanoate biosynthesis repressor PhaR, partial [Corallococcus interemptor]
MALACLPSCGPVDAGPPGSQGQAVVGGADAPGDGAAVALVAR